MHSRFLSALTLPALASVAWAQPSLRLLDSSLELRPGVIAAISNTDITLRFERQTVTVPIAQCAAIVPPAWIDETAAPTPMEPARWTLDEPGSLNGVLETTGGEVLPGSFAAGDPSTDSLRWLSPTLGPITLPLDHLNRINFAASAPPRRTNPTTDILTLLNGDRLEGFVTRLGSAVTLDGQPGPIPLDRIASIDLANPPQPPNRALVSCRDGTVFAADSLHWSGDADFTASRDTAQATLRISNLRSVNLRPDRLHPLSSLADPAWSAPDSRRWTPPPARLDSATALGAHTLRLPGPGSATWSLPQSAARISLTIELPADCRAWGNPTVSVSCDGNAAAPLWTGSLHREAPSASLNLTLPPSASSLTITIAAGPQGDIQNDVILRNALILTN